MATAYRPSCLLFDIHSVESYDKGIKGTSFWKEYAELKADFYTKFINEYQHVVDKLRKKLENLSEEDVQWVRSLKKELEREEAAIRLQEAYHKTYLKFTDELTEVDYAVSAEEQDFAESIQEFQKVKNDWEHLQSELSTKNEKISHRLDKFGEFLCRGGIWSNEKMREWIGKFDKVTSDYDALILTERLKKQELLMLSHELEQKYRDKETKRLSMVTSKWKNCLGSLQGNIEHFSAESNDVKAVKYASRIDIGAIIKGTLKRETADYSDFKISKIIIARNPQVEEFLRTQKEELAAENTDITAVDVYGHEEATKRRRRSKSRIKPVQNEESKKEEKNIVEDKNMPDISDHDQGESTNRTKSKTRTKPAVQSKDNRKGQGEVIEQKNMADVNVEDHVEFTKRTKPKTRTKPVLNDENRKGQDEVVENKTMIDVNVDDQASTKRTKSKTRTKAVQKEETGTQLAKADAAETSMDSDIVQPFNQNDLVLEDIDDISEVELLEDIKPQPRPLASIHTTSGLKPVNHDKTNMWVDSTPSTSSLKSVNHDKNNMWVDSTPSTSGLKPVNHNKTNTWVDSTPSTSGLKPVNHDKNNMWVDSTPSTSGLKPVNQNKTNTWVDSTPSTSGVKPVNHDKTNMWVDSTPSTSGHKPVNHDKNNMWVDSTPSTSALKPVNHDKTNMWVDSTPSTSALKPVNHNKTNTWVDSTPSTSSLKPFKHDKTHTSVDSTASEHSETEEETTDNNDRNICPETMDTLPKEYVPYKAKVMQKYKKQRPVEMSVKRGDKVKVLIPPDTDGFVLVSKRTTFHLQKKKGYVPVSLLLPLNKK